MQKMWRDRASDAVKRTPTRSCNGVATGAGNGEVDGVLYCIQQDECKPDNPRLCFVSLVFESGSDLGAKSAAATSIVRIFSQTLRRGGGDGARL